MSFKVEKGIPIPPKGQHSSYQHKYPFKTMEVGDSFEVDGITDGIQEAKLRSTIWSSGRRYSRKFTARKNGKTMRVWRTK